MIVIRELLVKVQIQENDNDNPIDQKNNDIEEERDKNLEEPGDNEIHKE